jgi:hypothetical protein
VLRVTEEGADTADDVGRRVGVAGNALDRDLRALDGGGSVGQPTLACVGIGD